MHQQQSESSQRDTKPRVRLMGEEGAFLAKQLLPKLEWNERWLNGPQYRLILSNVDDYCQKFGLAKYPANQHPVQIYESPKNGMIYFLEGSSLQGFRFPRIDHRKTYRWKKMNFKTHLPKQNPIITYLVASSSLTNTIQQEPQHQYRMHIVIPYQCPDKYILCHVRRVGGHVSKDEAEMAKGVSLPGCFRQNVPDFYRLFAFIHNYHSVSQ